LNTKKGLIFFCGSLADLEEVEACPQERFEREAEGALSEPRLRVLGLPEDVGVAEVHRHHTGSVELHCFCGIRGARHDHIHHNLEGLEPAEVKRTTHICILQ
jgi:hypothetical protein